MKPWNILLEQTKATLKARVMERWDAIALLALTMKEAVRDHEVTQDLLGEFISFSEENQKSRRIKQMVKDNLADQRILAWLDVMTQRYPESPPKDKLMYEAFDFFENYHLFEHDVLIAMQKELDGDD